MRDFKHPWRVEGNVVVDSEGEKVAEVAKPAIAALVAAAPVLREFLRKGLPGGSGMDRGDLARILALMDSIDR